MYRVSSVINKMIEYYSGDAKRVNHFLKVYAFAKTIGETEKLDSEKLMILELASVVHDIGIKISEQKYNKASGKYQQIEGPPLAKELLESEGFDEITVSRVCFLVGHHHTYSSIDDIDFQILVEADFLVNIYEANMGGNEICTIRNKYFKTAAGRNYLDMLFQK